jgi:hypothetical protein
MGGANTGRSNKDEEVNPPEELCHTTPIAHTRQGREAHTTFRDRRPDVPPLAVEPQHRTTQPPTAQAAQGKLLVDHGRHTNIRGRRPGLKVQPPSLGRVDRADHTAAQAAQHRHPSHDEPRPYLIRPPPAMIPEAAAASAHKHNFSRSPPRPPPTMTQEECKGTSTN